MLAALIPILLLPNAHAHNDYAHPRPLLDALEQGFLNVEADVYLVEGELRVGHDRRDLKPGRTLESLYLDPLSERVRKNHGNVYEQTAMLTLMVDLKEDGARLQPVLSKRLAKYRGMLTERKGSTVQARAVRIVLSGARTGDCAAGDGFFFKDGQPKDVGDPAYRTPWISDSYSASLGTLASPLPSVGKTKLETLVRQAHAGGKLLRLWGGPDGPETWRELRNAGVDLINTDKLEALRRFLLGSG